MTRSKLLAVGAFALAFSLVNAGTALAGPLSKQEWREQVTEICTDANDEVRRIAGELFAGLDEGEDPTEEQLAGFADEVIPVIEDAVDDTDALEEPTSFKKGVTKWLSAIEDVLAEAEDDPNVFDTEDPFRKPNRLAKKLGLKGCV